MEFKINVDPSNIDYNTINKQIQEQLEKMNLMETFNIESIVKDKIDKRVKEHIDSEYNPYLDTSWDGGITSHGFEMMKRISEERIKTLVNEKLDKIFSDRNITNTLNTVMMESIADIFVSMLFKKVEGAIVSGQCVYERNLANQIKSEIRAQFHL